MIQALWRFAAGALLSIFVTDGASAQTGSALPPYLAGLSGTKPLSASELATRDILQLDYGMLSLYDNAGSVYRRNFLARHPVILALFTNTGGRMILYRPGQSPVEAASVPAVYQVLKSVGHSTMAIGQIVVPSIGAPDDQRWIAPMQAYRAQMKTALDGLGAVDDIAAEWKDTLREILGNNVAYMDDCLARRALALESLEAFSRRQDPLLKRIIDWAAATQVGHWMSVLDAWKASLGPNWQKTYAATNTIYVARQNNVLYSVLAQYFGPDALNDRLILLETLSFTTTPQDMMMALGRIVGDRSIGNLFFGNYWLMDYELMGGGARRSIGAEMQRRGQQPFLPPAVPFGSRQWPMLITPGPGPTSLEDLK